MSSNIEIGIAKDVKHYKKNDHRKYDCPYSKKQAFKKLRNFQIHLLFIAVGKNTKNNTWVINGKLKHIGSDSKKASTIRLEKSINRRSDSASFRENNQKA